MTWFGLIVWYNNTSSGSIRPAFFPDVTFRLGNKGISVGSDFAPPLDLTTQMGGQMGGQIRSRHFFVRLELTTRQWKILTTPKCPPPSRQLFSPHAPQKIDLLTIATMSAAAADSVSISSLATPQPFNDDASPGVPPSRETYAELSYVSEGRSLKALAILSLGLKDSDGSPTFNPSVLPWSAALRPTALKMTNKEHSSDAIAFDRLSSSIEKHSNSLVAAAQIVAVEQEKNHIHERIFRLSDQKREMTLRMTTPGVLENQVIVDAIMQEIQGIEAEIAVHTDQINTLIATPTKNNRSPR